MKSLIAIDPGANGGFAIFDKGEITVEKIPSTYPEIFDVLMNMAFHMDHPVAVVERVGQHRVGNNASASVRFARHCGHLEMALYATNIPIMANPTPQQWQKCFGLPKDKAERKRKVKELMQARYPYLAVTLWNADALGILTWYMVANHKTDEGG